MEEKEKGKVKTSEEKREESPRFDDRKLEHKVTVMDKTFTVKTRKGATLKELLKEFFEQNPNPNIKLQEMTVMFNGTPVEFKNGELLNEHNHVLLEGCQVIMTQKIRGGIMTL